MNGGIRERKAKKRENIRRFNLLVCNLYDEGQGEKTPPGFKAINLN